MADKKATPKKETKTSSKKYTSEQQEAINDSIRAIKDHYGDTVSDTVINNIIGNIEVETGWSTLREKAYSWDGIKNNENLKTGNKNLDKWGGTKEDYNKLSRGEKLSVLYYGDTDHTDVAGGTGVLQLTSANYGGNDKTADQIRAAAEELGIDSNALSEDFYNSTLLTLKVYDGRGVDFNKYKSPEELRKKVINPHEKLTDNKRKALDYYANLNKSSDNTRIDPSKITNSEFIDDRTKSELLNLNAKEGLSPRVASALNGEQGQPHVMNGNRLSAMLQNAMMQPGSVQAAAGNPEQLEQQTSDPTPVMPKPLGITTPMQNLTSMTDINRSLMGPPAPEFAADAKLEDNQFELGGNIGDPPGGIDRERSAKRWKEIQKKLELDNYNKKASAQNQKAFEASSEEARLEGLRDRWNEAYNHPLWQAPGMIGGMGLEDIALRAVGKGISKYAVPAVMKALPKFSKATGNAVKPKSNFKSEIDLVGATKAENKVLNKTDDVNKSIKPAWQMQELPGLHLKSTMEGEAISKIVDKTGRINTDQAFAIIGKEAGGAEKLEVIKKGFGDNIPKKLDYNEFRKTVQDQLIPLERNFNPNANSHYGLDNINYNLYDKVSINDGIQTRIKADNILENQTLTLGNKSKFGRGSAAHYNPEETLGHAHFLRDAETPDVLTVTQIQSDAFQGSHRIMPNKTGASPEIEKWEKILTPEGRKELVEAGGEDAADLAQKGAREFLEKAKKDAIYALGPNPTQKQLLDKNHQERYLQELVDYAGKRGDINKVRVPTSETSAKVQGYKKSVAIDGKLNDEVSEVMSAITNLETFKLNAKGDDLIEINKELKKLNEKFESFPLDYPTEHQTILKKYSEQPKTIKKLFGTEPKVITDNKGNTWYEFDIPKKFKEGKGEIKAFGLLPFAPGIETSTQSQDTNNFALGGQINTQNMNPNNILSEFNTGGTHETHPDGGIPLNKASNGQFNLVEEGETKYGNYIFTNSLKLSKDQAKALKLDEKYIGKTFADISKDINKQIEDRPYDGLTKKTATATLDKLVMANEDARMAETGEEFTDEGGQEFMFGGMFGAAGAAGAAGGAGGTLGMTTQVAGAMGSALPQQNQFIDDGTSQTIDGAKQAIGSAFGPFGMAIAAASKAGEGVGNAVGGDTGAVISSSFAPEKAMLGIFKNEDANVMQKIGGTMPGISGLISKSLKDKQAKKDERINALAAQSKFTNDFKMGGTIDPKKKKQLISVPTDPSDNNRDIDLKIAYANAKGLDNEQLSAFEAQDISDEEWRNRRDKFYGEYTSNWRNTDKNNKFSQSSPEYMQMGIDRTNAWHKQDPRQINDTVNDYRMNGPANPTEPIAANGYVPDQGVLANNNKFRTGGDTDPSNMNKYGSKYGALLDMINLQGQPSLSTPGFNGTSDDFHTGNPSIDYKFRLKEKPLQNGMTSVKPFAINQPSNNVTPMLNKANVGKEDGSDKPGFNYMGAARYVPMLGNAARLLTAPDAEVTKYNRLDNRYKRDYNDNQEVYNKIAEGTGTARQSLLEASGGNLGSASASLQQLGINNLGAISDANSANRKFDMQQNQLEQGFNKDTDVRNQAISTNEITANEQNRAAARSYKEQLMNTLLADLGEMGKESKLAEILRNTSGGYTTEGLKVMSDYYGNKKKKGGALSSLYSDISTDENKIKTQYIKDKYGY